MSADHNDLTDISIVLGPAPPTQAGFGRVAIFAEDIAFTSPADTYRIYETASAISDDSDLSNTAAEMATTALEQSPQPADVAVVDVDISGGDTYADAVDNAISAGLDWYGTVIEARTGAEALTMAQKIASYDKLFCFQTSESDWIDTTSVPSAYSGIEIEERTLGIFHDTDSEYADVAFLASRLTFDPDDTSAAFQGVLSGVAQYSTGLSDTQESNAEDQNINLVLPFGSEPTYVSPGVNVKGRQAYELVTRDWFKARLQTRITQLKLRYDNRGEKVPLTSEGQDVVRGEIEAQFAIGVSAGHFAPDTTDVTFPDPIPNTDLQSGTMKASGSAKFEVSGNNFDFDFDFNRV